MLLTEKTQNTSLPTALHYRLYCLQSRQAEPLYYLEITLGQERFCCPLNTASLSEAKRIYRLVLKGKVTPCTARDVLEDICS